MSAVMSGNGSRRAASVWVAGVGAALLIVAAGLFVAVQWNHIPDEAKLAVILGVTGGFLLAGRRLRRTLPATGGVLFHLGAFLLPVDLAAVNLRVGMPWQQLLLAEGILGVVAFTGLGYLDESVTLRAAASISVVATALGIGANTPVPAPVALAIGAALLSLQWPRSRSALAFAVTAGYMPLFAIPLQGIDRVPHLPVTLGLPSAGKPLAAVAAGAIAAVVIARAAHLERDLRLAVVAIGSLVASGTTAWIAAALPKGANVLAVPAAFVIVELVVLALQRDEFWRRPFEWIVVGAEMLAGFAAIDAVQYVVGAHLASPGLYGLSPEHVHGVAYGIAAVGALLAVVRHARRGSDQVSWRLSAVGTSIFAVVAVQFATSSPLAAASALAVVGVALLLSRHPITDGGAIVALITSVPLAGVHSRLGFVVGAIAAAGLVWAAGAAARSGQRIRSFALTATMIVTLSTGAAFGARVIDPFYAVLAFVAGCWFAANALDVADRALGVIPRVAILLSLVATSAFTPGRGLVFAVVLAALFVGDSVMSENAWTPYFAILPAQVAVALIGIVAHLHPAYVGLVMCLAAVTWAGLAVIANERWRLPLQLTAALGVIAGTIVAASDPTALGLALIVSGCVILGTGVLERESVLCYTGGISMVVGTLVELSAAHVTVSEAYVAPVALALLIAGLVARRMRDVGSWVAYAPSVAIFGVTAFVERMIGGPGWHSVIAGATGVVAVAAGGGRRLAGPLFTGTMLLAAVVGFESMAVAATVPTWAWCALGGSALLATGIYLERTDTSPVIAGRRLVEAISANFS